MSSSLPYYQPAGNATKRLVKAGYTLIKSVEVMNPNTSQVFIQMFDAAATADVTLGSTAPDFPKLIGPGDGTNHSARILDFSASPLRFQNGFVFAITTTETGSTGPSSNCTVTITYD